MCVLDYKIMYQKITKTFEYKFFVPSAGLHSIILSAICQKKDNLRIEVDGATIATNVFGDGRKLKGTLQTIVLVMRLKQGERNLKFIAKTEADIMEEPKITSLGDGCLVTLLENISSDEKDCQPWIIIALIDLSLKILDVSVCCQKRFIDNDDVKLVVNGRIHKNNQFSWWGKNWFWQGRKLRGKIEADRFYYNLPKGIHYIELWADRKPILKSLDVLVDADEEIKIAPTDKNPKWTGNFYDDTEAIILARLIFGEANGQPHEAKTWVGWSVINRTKAKSWWPDNIHGVILQTGQYDPFKHNDPNFPKIISPLGYKDVSEIDKKSWFECCEIAQKIISGEVENPTEATHFHGIGVTRDWFKRHMVPKGKFLKK